jgi:hypothetical protein
MIRNQSPIKSEKTNVRSKTTHPETALAMKNTGEEIQMERRWITVLKMASTKLVEEGKAEETKEVAKRVQPRKPIVTVWTWVMRLSVPPAGSH